MKEKLERIEASLVDNFFYKNNPFNNNQCDFCKKRSCFSQLLNHVEDILQPRDKDCDVDIVCLDFEYAFGKVDYAVLSKKLLRLGGTASPCQ